MSHTAHLRPEFSIAWDADPPKPSAEPLFEGEGFVVHNLLSETECAAIIEGAEEVGLEDLHLRHRTNKRAVIHSTQILPEVMRRLRDFLPSEITLSAASERYHCQPAHYGLWTRPRLNPHLRLCRYDTGDLFERHYDGGYHPDSMSDRTLLTCMLYLNDGYGGGATRFFRGHASQEPFYALRAAAGDCIVFPQNMLHDGEAVMGTKYMMRTDIWYELARADTVVSADTYKALELYRRGAACEAAGDMADAAMYFRAAWDIDPDIDMLA